MPLQEILKDGNFEMVTTEVFGPVQASLPAQETSLFMRSFMFSGKPCDCFLRVHCELKSQWYAVLVPLAPASSGKAPMHALSLVQSEDVWYLHAGHHRVLR